MPLKQLYEMATRNKDIAQNGINGCREKIRDIEKEMSYYEGQRDEACSLLYDIEELIKGEQLRSPNCDGENNANVDSR